ncbi:MAG: Crp/Fnr family transcriptional regulator [Bacteroidia bacterium]
MNFFERLNLLIEDYDPNIWSKSLTLQRNEFLKIRDSKDTNVYYIEEGSLRVILETDAEEISFRFGYEGDFVSALDSFITDQPSKFSIKAIKKTRVKVITKESFMRFLESDLQHLLLWQEMMNHVILAQGERELDLLIQSPIERYERVLKRSPKLFQLIPGKYIASYLRMSPETYSRIKKT